MEKEERKPKQMSDYLKGNHITPPFVMLWGYRGSVMYQVSGVKQAKELYKENIVSYERWKFLPTKEGAENWWSNFADSERKFEFLQAAKKLSVNKLQLDVGITMPNN